MASTYSDLKIELIGTGEQVGTWGATTNTNLGTAIEEAIVGSADVAFSSADVTLTLTNTNGSQAARHLRLNLTGTSGGARNLILGSGCQIDKPYIIANGLADTVTVKNTTGTGVAVPAGKSMWVYNNGTNVVEVMNHAASLTLGTALPVASGGTGATTLTGVVKGTGTSALTAGSVNLASEVTGTLPIANGGTGSTTDSGARTNLGLGTIATQNANNVSITGGTITGITDLAVADGGTGRSTLTANNVILGNGTSAVNFVAPGTSGNVLTSNGTTWTSAASNPFVTGMIMLWSGSIASVPSGWALCNGSNGTPDLRNRFVVGAGSTYAVDATGGSADAIVVSHTHTATSTVTDPGHLHVYRTGVGENTVVSGAPANAATGPTYQTINTDTNTTGITVATTNASTGSSGTNANLPPYYALAYIMKL